MSEVRFPLPAEVEDRLQEGCRDCWYARNLLRGTLRLFINQASDEDNHEMTSPSYSHEAIQAAITEAERINADCPGWQGSESPQESLINADEGPALAMSTSLKENCPIDLQ